MSLSPESQAYLTKADAIARFVASEDWQTVKAELTRRVNEMDSVSNIDAASFEEIGRAAVARAGAVQIVRDWITEIEGTAALSPELKKQTKSEDNIIRTVE